MSTHFPAFISLRYQPDNAARAGFLDAVDRLATDGNRRLDAFTKEAQRQLSSALSAPRTASGSLDLGAAQARQAAQAAQARAIAAREVANATRLAAREEQDYSQAARQAVASTEALAREEEAAARSARSHASALEQVQQRLNRQASGTQAVIGATNRIAIANDNAAAATRRQNVAFAQFGQQMTDVAVQMQSGTNPFTIITQQGPQAAWALSGLAGSANKAFAAVGRVGQFLSGPWGGAIAIGTVALAPLIARIFEAGDALDKELAKLKENAAQSDATRRAKELFAETEEGVRQAILDQKDALDEQDRALESAAEKALASARANLENEISIRRTTKALLDQALAEQAILAEARQRVGGTNDATAMIDADRSAAVERLRAKVAEQSALIATAQANVNRAASFASVEAGTRAADPVAMIKRKYEGPDGLIEAARKRAVAEGKVGAELERQVLALRKQQDAETERARKAERTSRSTTERLPPVTGEEVARLIGAPITSGKRSAARNKAIGGAANSYHLIGQAIDIPLTINGKALTKESIRAALEPAGIVIKELLGPGDPGHSDHFHIAFARARKGADDMATSIGRAEDRLDRLREFAADAMARVAGIQQGFDQTPAAIARANTAMAQLNDLADDLDGKVRGGLDPKVADTIRAAIEQTKGIVTASADQPFRAMQEAAREQAAIQNLLVQGREIEAEVLERALALSRDQGELSQSELSTLHDIVAAERLRADALEKANAARQREVALVEATRDNLRDTFQSLGRGGGIGAIGDAFKRQFDTIRTNAIDTLFDSLLGDFFDSEKDKALGFDKVREASDRQVSAIHDVTDALAELRRATMETVTAMAAGPAGSLEQNFDRAFGVTAAANDNTSPDIVVTGTKSPRAFLGEIVGRVAGVFVDPKTAQKIGAGIADGIGSRRGAAYGMLASGTVFGGSGSPLMSALGGGIGEKLLSKPLEKGLESIAKGLGDFAGPLAGIAGGLIGGAIGSLFSKTPKASATIGVLAGGDLGVVSTTGNSRTRKQASNAGANEAIGSLEAIAEALGATIDAGRGAVSIGVRKGNYRVDPSGSGATKLSRGAIDFGQDSAAAIKAATLNLIQDGVLGGLRASTLRLLQGGTDLDRAVQKAVDFEGVFSALKEINDPVGAAIDGVDKEFKRLRKIFDEANATTEEYANLEEVYNHRRADAIKQARSQAMGSLMNLMDELTIGDSGLSIRSRIEAARGKYDPLASRVAAGDVTAYDDFSDAASTLLALTRELYGSTDDYWSLFDGIKSLTQGALDAQQSIADAAAGAGGLFGEGGTSGSTVPADDTASVTSAIAGQTDALLAGLGGTLQAMNDNIITLIERSTAAPGSPSAFQFAGNF